MNSKALEQPITRAELQNLLYECMYTEKERKSIPNDGSVFLSDVEAAMSLHDKIVRQETIKAQKRLISDLIQELQLGEWVDKDKSFEKGMNQRLNMVGQLLNKKQKELEG